MADTCRGAPPQSMFKPRVSLHKTTLTPGCKQLISLEIERVGVAWSQGFSGQNRKDWFSVRHRLQPQLWKRLPCWPCVGKTLIRLLKAEKVSPSS